MTNDKILWMHIDKLFETRTKLFSFLHSASGGYMHEFKENKAIIWEKLIYSKCTEPIQFLWIFNYFSNAIKIKLHECEGLLDAGNKY